jgi:hypothetical protein
MYSVRFHHNGGYREAKQFNAIWVLLFVIVGLFGFIPEAQAAGLPPRPLPPAPVPVSSSAEPVLGGWIMLQITDAEMPQELWTTIEWQNEHGDWYVVDGWRGTPEADGMISWYVGAELIGDEVPFRWHVFTGEGGDLIGTSDVFGMPSGPGQTVLVTFTVAP